MMKAFSPFETQNKKSKKRQENVKTIHLQEHLPRSFNPPYTATMISNLSLTWQLKYTLN